MKNTTTTYSQLFGTAKDEIGRAYKAGLEFNVDHLGNPVGRISSVKDHMSRGEDKETAQRLVRNDKLAMKLYRAELKAIKRIIKAWNGWNNTFGVMAEGTTGNDPKSLEELMYLINRLNDAEVAEVNENVDASRGIGFTSYVNGRVELSL